MRRIRQLFMTLCVMALFAGLGIPAKGEETRSAYRPVKVETVAAGDSGQPHIVRTYHLSPVDDPAGIPTKDFEDGGWVYHLADMSSEEKIGTDSRQITRTVTKSSDTDNTEKILRKLDAAMDVTTDDGYSGTLHLDHTSVTVDAAGYATRNHSLTATRVYPDLTDADLSLVPKTIEENGKTLTLDDVQWEEGWQTDAEGGFVRYCATASYVGTTSDRYATGYTVTANYTGEVSRSDVEMVTWRVEFAPVREAEPVTVPPQPEENDTEKEPETEVSSDGETEVVEETGTFSDGAVHDTENQQSDGTVHTAENEQSGGTVLTRPIPAPVQLPDRAVSGPDYSGLIRTLFSCGLLIALAGAAYFISKFKRKGGNST